MLFNHWIKQIKQLDNFNIPTNIYIDLSKAFDTLNFDILSNKLDYYGVQGCPNRLIYSYLLTDGNLLISMDTNLAMCL